MLRCWVSHIQWLVRTETLSTFTVGVLLTLRFGSPVSLSVKSDHGARDFSRFHNHAQETESEGGIDVRDRPGDVSLWKLSLS